MHKAEPTIEGVRKLRDILNSNVGDGNIEIVWDMMTDTSYVQLRLEETENEDE